MVEPAINIVCTKLAQGENASAYLKHQYSLHMIYAHYLFVYSMLNSHLSRYLKFCFSNTSNLQPSRQTMYLSLICLVWKRVPRNIKFVFFAFSDNLFALNLLHTSLNSLLTISHNISISLCE